jgi:hypothetical protein
MSNIEQARKALLQRVLEGGGKTSSVERQSAFNNSGLAESIRLLVDKVARAAQTITNEDFERATQSGLSEDQIFEIVACAAIGQANRQYDVARIALETALRN